MRNRAFVYCVIVVMAVVCAACGKRYVPKPYGYVRTYIPDTSYTRYNYFGICSFALSDNADVIEREDSLWANLHYSALTATLHCSYSRINNNLRQLTDDAQDFVYKHSAIATGISEREYFRPEDNIYCILYELGGNTASPYQFCITDSVRNFFRASLYFECLPNRDSLQPSVEYMHNDIIRLVESFKWTESGK